MSILQIKKLRLQGAKQFSQICYFISHDPEPALQVSAPHLFPDTFITILRATYVTLCGFYPIWSLTERPGRANRTGLRAGQMWVQRLKLPLVQFRTLSKNLTFLNLCNFIFSHFRQGHGDIKVKDLENNGYSINTGCYYDYQRFRNGM